MPLPEHATNLRKLEASVSLPELRHRPRVKARENYQRNVVIYGGPPSKCLTIVERVSYGVAIRSSASVRSSDAILLDPPFSAHPIRRAATYSMATRIARMVARTIYAIDSLLRRDQEEHWSRHRSRHGAKPVDV